MTKNSSQRSALVMLSVLSAIVSTTFLISILARGYIPEFDNGIKIKATGLLSANSIPKNASVIINEKLYTTTDDTVNLTPGDYQLKIAKEGYLPWNKKITIQKEMVYQAEASLFKSNPIIGPITIQGATNSAINSDLTQIAYLSQVSTPSTKSGVYIVESTYLASVLGKYQPRLVAQNPYNIGDTSVSLTFSPNSKQLVLHSKLKRNIYIVDLTQGESKQNLVDVTQTFDKINLEWQQLLKQTAELNLSKLPKVFLSTIATNPASITFSDNDTKFLYLLNKQFFVYDIEKDLNHLLGDQSTIISPFWLPKSNNIIYSYSGKIKSIEFDGTNDNTIYSNDFKIKTLIPQLDGDKILISTATKSATPENIFILTIR